MELNREQIVKALQDCIDRPKCIDCPNLTLCSGHGFEYLLVQALSLIKELTEDVIALPCLREWNSDGLWCGYELLYDDKGTFTVIHFGKSQKEDAIKIFEEIKSRKEQRNEKLQ